MESIGLLFKVLWSPGEAMFFLSKKPRVLLPVIFLSLCSLVSTIALQTKVPFGTLLLNMMARAPQSQQMPEDQRANFERMVTSPVAKGVMDVFAPVSMLFTLLIVTVIYFGLFTMLGREAGFKEFFSISAFAFVPMIFSQIAGVVRAFVMPVSSLALDEIFSLSPAAFLDRDSVSPMLFAAVNSIDFITIWILSLLVIGYGFVTRKSISPATRTAVVLSPFLFYVLLLKLAPLALAR
jgi:hypothetical protein